MLDTICALVTGVQTCALPISVKCCALHINVLFLCVVSLVLKCTSRRVVQFRSGRRALLLSFSLPAIYTTTSPGSARPTGYLLKLILRLGCDSTDRTSVVKGKSVSGRVDLGGRRIIKKK